MKGSGVRINCISPGQIDIGVNLESVDRKGQNHSLPPSSLQSESVQKQIIGLERAGQPYEVARVAGFLASGFSSYMVRSYTLLYQTHSLTQYSDWSEYDSGWRKLSDESLDCPDDIAIQRIVVQIHLSYRVVSANRGILHIFRSRLRDTLLIEIKQKCPDFTSFCGDL